MPVWLRVIVGGALSGFVGFLIARAADLTPELAALVQGAMLGGTIAAIVLPGIMRRDRKK